MRLNSILLLLLVTSSAACTAPPSTAATQAAGSDKPALPNEKEATDAIIRMLDMADMQVEITTKLGTCIPAMDARHAGQIACTVAVRIGAGTSETQADFYRDGTTWEAQPSTSQEKLPFPDPAL